MPPIKDKETEVKPKKYYPKYEIVNRITRELLDAKSEADIYDILRHINMDFDFYGEEGHKYISIGHVVFGPFSSTDIVVYFLISKIIPNLAF